MRKEIKINSLSNQQLIDEMEKSNTVVLVIEVPETQLTRPTPQCHNDTEGVDND